MGNDSNKTDVPHILTLDRIGTSDGSLNHQHQLVILLAYLAHEGPTDRTTLATLFWSTSSSPLNNLSSALTRIRQAAPGALITDKRTVSTPCRTDAIDLLDALKERDADAHERYGGSFLGGFQLKAVGLELEEWIFETRDTIADVVATSAIAALEALAEHGSIDRAGDLAQRAVETAASTHLLLDKISILYPALALTGRPGATRLLALAEEAGVALPSATPARAPHNDGLLGRDGELERVHDLLRESSIVSVFGIGGVGKTRLAQRIADDMQADGTTAVSRLELAAEADGVRLLSAVAEHLDAAHLGDVIVAGIAERVSSKTLVVIDDVVPSPSIMKALVSLGEIQNLRLLVLSRLRLSGPGIEALPIRGLASSTSQGDPGPAVSLFRRRIAPSVLEHLDPETFTEHATTICTRVSGLPLAIELTAAWLRLIPITQVQSLLEDDEILDEAPPGEDLSLSRVIEQSWTLLPDDTQEALSSLAVMQGSFDRESARAVAAVGVGDLTNLHDHSLLDAGVDGRVRCHALVQAFARRRLMQDEERHLDLQLQHSQWYLQRLIDAAADLTGPHAGDRLRDLQVDQPNIEAAWANALHRFATDELIAGLSALDDLLLRSGQLFVAKRVYTDTLDGLWHGSEPGEPGLAAAVANNLAWVEMLLGDPDSAARYCSLGLDWLPVGDAATHVALLRTQCALFGNAGDARSALDGYTKAREISDALDDARLHALLDEDIGRAHAMLGEHEPAIAAFRRTLDAARTIGDPHMEARSYLLLGVSQTVSDPVHALVLFDEGEQIAAAHDLRHLVAYFPSDRGQALRHIGRHADAAVEFERGIAMADEVGDRVLHIICQLGAARGYFRSGDPTTARPLLQSGLRASIHAKLWPHVLGAALDVADLAVSANPDQGAPSKLFAMARSHPNALQSDLAQFTSAPAVERDGDFEALRLDEVCELTLRVAQLL